MNIFGDGPQPFQNYPFLKDRARGWALWWRGGDRFICRGFNKLRPGGNPDGGKFFNYLPDETEREHFKRKVLPFFTCRWGRFGFYIGYKAYGFDSPAYLDFPGVHTWDVAEDSVALSGFTWRFSTKVPAPTELPTITVSDTAPFKAGDYIATSAGAFKVLEVKNGTVMTVDPMPWWARGWALIRGKK